MTRFLSSLDPRTKLLAVLALSPLVFLLSTSFFLFLTLSLLLLISLERIPLSRFLSALRPLLPLFAFLFLVQALLGEPVLGLILLWRFSLLLWLSFLLVSTTPISSLVLAVERMTRPFLGRHARNLGVLLSSTIRFVPVLEGESQRVRNAMKARSLSRWKMRHFSVLVLSLLRKTFRRTGALADAFVSRCYRDTGATSFRTLAFRPRDYLSFLLLSFLFVGVIAWT